MQLDYKLNKIFSQVYKEIYGKEIKIKEKYNNVLKLEEIEKLEKELSTNSVYREMLGYAFFLPEVPRYIKNMKNFDILLLQIDSEEGSSLNIIWRDIGVANCFIERKAQEEKDFSKILYNLDCS